jgi:uncharacterized cupin superfamily protein
MSDPNVLHPEWEADFRDTPVRMRAVRVGAAAGAQELGASLYEVEPGGVVAPYHLHHANEELAVVLAGEPLLRTPDGTRRLTPGSVVAFVAGPDGAHRMSNPGPEVARVLIVSTMNFPEIAEHVTTGTTLAMTGPGEGKVFPSGNEVEFLEAYQRAIAGDADRYDGTPGEAAGR